MRSDLPMRRTLALFTLPLALTALPAVALACPPDGSPEVVRPVVRPVRPVSLVERAERLELDAIDRDREASRFTDEATRIGQRVQALRAEASRLTGEERAEVLTFAARLDADAAGARLRAAESRRVAAQLREQAKELRKIASGNNRPPEWRKRTIGWDS